MKVPAPAAPLATARPVKLEVNNSGAWKTVARFDAGDDAAGAAAQSGAEQLGQVSSMTWRIATDEPLPSVLMHWSREKGWVAR